MLIRDRAGKRPSREPAPSESPRPARAPGRFFVAAASLGLVAASLSSLWAVALPAFSGPDERVHVSSVVRLIEGGGWPLPYEARIPAELIRDVIEAGVVPNGYEADVVPEPADRSAMLAPTELPEGGVDNMVQHPPLYYGIVAAVVAALGGGDLRWDHALLVMRLVTALLAAPTTIAAAYLVRAVTRSGLAGLVGAAALLTIPFLANSAGYVSNDPLLVTLTSTSLAFAASAWRSPDAGWWRPVLAGVALGLALLTKGLALFLIPAIAAFAIMAAVRSRRRMSARVLLAVLPLVVGGAIGGWWWLRNLILLGVVQPSTLADRAHATEPPEGYSLTGFLGNAAIRVGRTFWGRGAREELALPTTLVDAAGIALLLVILLAVLLSKHRGALLVVLSFSAVALLVILRNAHGIYWDLGRPDRGIQGRYLFGGIAAYALLGGILWGWLASIVPRRRQGLVAAMVVGAAVAVGGIAFSAIAARIHPGAAGLPDLIAAGAASGSGGWLPVLLLALLSVGTVSAVMATVRYGRSRVVA